MVDMQDPYTKGLLSSEDWAEIMKELLSAIPYARATSTYMYTFDAVTTLDDLKMRLSRHSYGLKLELVYMYLQSWLVHSLSCYSSVYFDHEMTSPPFAIERGLSERW